MSKVAVLDTQKRVLEPCHSAVARCLLREGKAAVYKRYPFTIIIYTSPRAPLGYRLDTHYATIREPE